MGRGQRSSFPIYEASGEAELDALSLSFPVEWEYDEKSQTYIAVIKDEEDYISQLISTVVSSFQIKDVKIHETSIEEIVRNIYETGNV